MLNLFIMVMVGALAFSPSPSISDTLGQRGLPPERAVLESAAPTYPVLALYANVSGVVIVDVIVKMDGTVKKCRIKQGHKLLSEACMNPAKRWRFQPSAQEEQIDLYFTLRILPKGSPSSEEMSLFHAPDQIEIRKITHLPVDEPVPPTRPDHE